MESDCHFVGEVKNTENNSVSFVFILIGDCFYKRFHCTHTHYMSTPLTPPHTPSHTPSQMIRMGRLPLLSPVRATSLSLTLTTPASKETPDKPE